MTTGAIDENEKEFNRESTCNDLTVIWTKYQVNVVFPTDVMSNYILFVWLGCGLIFYDNMNYAYPLQNKNVLLQAHLSDIMWL